MKFDRSETIDGVPLIRVRDFLREWRLFETTFNEMQVAEFFDRDGAAALRWLRAALDRGLVERNGDNYEVAPDGVRLCATKFVPRFDRARADKLVAELLHRTEAAAAGRCDDHLLEVTGLALFGSYLDEQAADLGDIDVLVGTRRLPELKSGNKQWHEHCWDLFRRDRRRVHRIADHLDWPYIKIKQSLRARNPRIALHDVDFDAEVIETDVRVIYLLPEGRLAQPRDCRPAEFVAALQQRQD
jgi:hypothetical protein